MPACGNTERQAINVELTYERLHKTTNMLLLMRFSFLMPLKELVRLYHAANDDTRRSGLGTIIQIRFNYG